jgi:hypothetical protein
MQYVKIKFTDPEDQSRVFLDLAQSGKFFMVKEDGPVVFVVPLSSLGVLEKAGVGYKELERRD